MLLGIAKKFGTEDVTGEKAYSNCSTSFGTTYDLWSNFIGMSTMARCTCIAMIKEVTSKRQFLSISPVQAVEAY